MAPKVVNPDQIELRKQYEPMLATWCANIELNKGVDSLVLEYTLG